MPDAITPIWKVIGSLWPLWVALLCLLWFTGTLGGLMSIVAHGAQAVLSFGTNFLARTVALGAGVGLVLLAIVMFNAIGAPAINGFFPAGASAPASAVQQVVPATGAR